MTHFITFRRGRLELWDAIEDRRIRPAELTVGSFYSDLKGHHPEKTISAHELPEHRVSQGDDSCLGLT